MQIRRLILNEIGPFSRLDLEFPAGTDPDRADVHLLVGPNGSGKSTVLSAIAQCFCREVEAGLAGRMRSPQSFVVLQTTLGWRGLRSDHLGKAPTTIEEEGIPTQHLGSMFGLYRNAFEGQFGPYAVAQALPGRALRAHGGVPFAVFAYGGLRSAANSEITGVQEQDDNPLREACLFSRPEGTRPLIQWIANTRSFEALYAYDGDAARAGERKTALSRLADALGKVIGGSVTFHLRKDPFAVLVGVDGGTPIPVAQLPDGLQSLLSWLGDLLMRLDRIPWATPEPVTDRSFVLLLDEVEVHLHPAWQRQVLPMVETLFPKAQIIASTHSPFVIGSASDAWIHRFHVEGGVATADPPLPPANGTSYPVILDDLMGIHGDFDVETERDLAAFRTLWKRRVQGDVAAEPALAQAEATLAHRSRELAIIVGTEMRELRRRLADQGKTSR